MSACAYCRASGPRPMHPMGGDEEIRLRERTALPFGFGILVGPDGVPTEPGGPNVPRAFVYPQDDDLVVGPHGPRMFLVTFSDPSPVVMAPPDPEIEDSHVARVGELYEAGRLHFVGHQANGKEGYMLLSARSLQDAWETAQNDPLISAGYFRSVDVKEIEGPYPWHRYGGPGNGATAQ